MLAEIKQEVFFYPVFKRNAEYDTFKTEELQRKFNDAIKAYTKAINVEVEQGIACYTDGSTEFEACHEAEWILILTLKAQIDSWGEPDVRWLSNGDPGFPGDSGIEIVSGDVKFDNDELLKILNDTFDDNVESVTVTIEDPEIIQEIEYEPDWDAMPGGHDYYD